MYVRNDYRRNFDGRNDNNYGHHDFVCKERLTRAEIRGKRPHRKIIVCAALGAEKIIEIAEIEKEQSKRNTGSFA